MKKAMRWLPVLALLGLFAAGVLYTPAERIDVEVAGCEVMQHDGDPWIVPASRLQGYCEPKGEGAPRQGVRTGAFQPIRHDDLSTVDPTFWNRLDTTFFCNLAVFSPENVVHRPSGGIGLQMGPGGDGDKGFSAASIATQSADFTYGRFEAVLKPPKTSGVVTAFFLYRFDPWQEIDAEFLGRDPTKMLINVYYNPGQEGDLYNYGFRGTPVMVDLGFDASEDFHTYAIEWERDEIRWFVDGRLVHVRSAGRPTPIPHLPMRVHVNTWPCCSEELAGPFDPAALPASAEVRSVSLYRWHPPPINRLQSMFSGGSPEDWRQRASWMQP